MGLPSKLANEPAVQRMQDELRALRRVNREGETLLGELAPVVESASPLRVFGGSQLGAALCGVGLGVLPSAWSRPVVATLGTLLCAVGGYYRRGEVYALGNGMLAPLTASLAEAGVRRAVARPSTTTASPDAEQAAPPAA